MRGSLRLVDDAHCSRPGRFMDFKTENVIKILLSLSLHNSHLNNFSKNLPIPLCAATLASLNSASIYRQGLRAHTKSTSDIREFQEFSA